MSHIYWAPDDEVRTWIAARKLPPPCLVWSRTETPNKTEVLWFANHVVGAGGILAVFDERLTIDEKRAIETLAILRYNLQEMM